MLVGFFVFDCSLRGNYENKLYGAGKDGFGWITFGALERNPTSQTVSTVAGANMSVDTMKMCPSLVSQVSKAPVITCSTIRIVDD